MKLPETTWQGRYLQNGCGGYCGAVQPQQFPSCDAQLGGDFAMATDDEGHVSSAGLGGAGMFAFNDQELREQYGYKSEQALYVVARKIIKYYYRTAPRYSYYDGCSDGGREAMEMAERYPDDFDGIIAGAPEIIAGPLKRAAGSSCDQDLRARRRRRRRHHHRPARLSLRSRIHPVSGRN